MLSEPLTILYAEDDPDIQMIGSMALADIGGFQLHLSNNGAEAVIAVDSVNPDLILLDVMMPQMDGPSALEALREKLGDKLPPVVFITAKASSQEIERLMALGATDVITKPFDPMTLADDIMRCWRQAQNE